MQDLIKFLNQNAGAIQAIFAIVVGIATVLLSGGMWREMRYTNLRSEQPNVQVMLEAIK